MLLVPSWLLSSVLPNCKQRNEGCRIPLAGLESPRHVIPADAGIQPAAQNKWIPGHGRQKDGDHARNDGSINREMKNAECSIPFLKGVWISTKSAFVFSAQRPVNFLFVPMLSSLQRDGNAYRPLCENPPCIPTKDRGNMVFGRRLGFFYNQMG